MGSLRFDFSGRHVLVTGGSRGIGKKIAEGFLKAGASVTLWDIQKPVRKAGASVRFHKVDVSSFSACEKGAEALTEPIDFLINNAGILRDKTLAKLTKEDYQIVIETNLNGVFYVTKSLLPFFKNHSFKRIVNLSSMVALYGNFGQTSYTAAKAGVTGLTKVWARELGRKGWTVNAVAPGFIQTDILRGMPKKALDCLVQKIPVGRLGRVEDVAGACLFLCSEEACYINGAVMSVDGGVTV